MLNASIEIPDSFRGQNINVRLSKNGKLKETAISEYFADATFNHELTLLSMHVEMKVLGQNDIMARYQNQLLKHFYKEQKQDKKNQKILGWGDGIFIGD